MFNKIPVNFPVSRYASSLKVKRLVKYAKTRGLVLLFYTIAFAVENVRVPKPCFPKP